MAASNPTLADVIERLRAEGQLTRNSGSNSLKQMRMSIDAVNTTLGVQTKVLQQISASMTEQAKDAARQAKLKFPKLPGDGQDPSSSSSKPSGGGGPKLRGGLALGAGIAAVGAGIAGFIAAMTLTGSSGFTGENLPKQAKNIALAMNEFAQMDNRAIMILGGLLASGVLLSKFSGVVGLVKAPVGMAAVGLGIGGFMAGLAAASEGMEFLGFDLSSFPKQTKNFVAGVNEFGSMNEQALKMMGVALGTGALFAAFPGIGGIARVGRAAVGMTAVGLGIGGFIAGIMLPAAAAEELGMKNFDGSSFRNQMGNLVAGFNEFSSLNENAMNGLTAIAGVGAIAGAAGGGALARAGMASLGMTMAGMGIGGFVAGLMLPSTAMAELGIENWDGSTFKTQMSNLVGGFKEFESLNSSTQAGLTILASLGAIAGGTGAGLMIAGMAATGMGLAGFGLGAFVAGFFAAGDVAAFLGADGSGFATMIENSAKAIKTAGDAAKDIGSQEFTTFPTAMRNLGDGYLAFSTRMLGANLADLASDFVEFINIFSDGDKKPFQDIVDLAEHSEELDRSGRALQTVANALSTFGDINVGRLGADYERFLRQLIGTVPLIDVLANGGTYGGGWFDGIDEVTLRKGILDPSMRLEELSQAAALVRDVLGAMNVAPSGATVSPMSYNAVPTGNDIAAAYLANDPRLAGTNQQYINAPVARGGDSVYAPTTSMQFNIQGQSPHTALNHNLPRAH